MKKTLTPPPAFVLRRAFGKLWQVCNAADNAPAHEPESIRLAKSRCRRMNNQPTTQPA